MKLILKAGGEPAVQALAEQVLRGARAECKRIEQMVEEDPAAYDSQSDGNTEIGVRLIRR